MNRRQAIGAAIALAPAAQAAPSARDRLIGVWKLIRCIRTAPDGRVEHPYGEQPVGRIVYDRAGRMSALLMRTGRKSTVPSGVALIAGKASAEEIREAIDGFIAYHGTFDVDEAKQIVTHHVQACLVPSWVNTDLQRGCKFAGKRLTLTSGTGTATEVTWEREAD